MVEVAEVPVQAAGRRYGRLYRWSIVIAVVSFIVGVWQVGIWANHWYIAERFFYVDVDEAAKQGPYWDITQLLRSGNEALRDGFIWLGIAALSVLVAVLLRRRWGR